MTIDDWITQQQAAVTAEEAKFTTAPLASAMTYRPLELRYQYEALVDAEDWAAIMQTAAADLTERRIDLPNLVTEAASLAALSQSMRGYQEFAPTGSLPLHNGANWTDFSQALVTALTGAGMDTDDANTLTEDVGNTTTSRLTSELNSSVTYLRSLLTSAGRNALIGISGATLATVIAKLNLAQPDPAWTAAGGSQFATSNTDAVMASLESLYEAIKAHADLTNAIAGIMDSTTPTLNQLPNELRSCAQHRTAQPGDTAAADVAISLADLTRKCILAATIAEWLKFRTATEPNSMTGPRRATQTYDFSTVQPDPPVPIASVKAGDDDVAVTVEGTISDVAFDTAFGGSTTRMLLTDAAGDTITCYTIYYKIMAGGAAPGGAVRLNGTYHQQSTLGSREAAIQVARTSIADPVDWLTWVTDYIHPLYRPLPDELDLHCSLEPGPAGAALMLTFGDWVDRRSFAEG